MATPVDLLQRRLERLKALRQPHEAVWRDCYDHSFPVRGLPDAKDSSAQQALDRKARLLHSVATEACRTLAAAVVSGAVPSSSVWGLLDVSGADDEGRAWLDEAAKVLHKEIHASTFDAAAFECSQDLVAGGQFALHIDVDREIGGLTFTQWPMAGVYAASTVAGGLVDTVFRELEMTAEQVILEFGAAAASGHVVAAASREPDTKVRICHAIFPRTPHAVGARMAKHLPVASVHFEIETKQLLRESGYHEMPVVVPRWSVIPGSAYAVGPMFDALPDARELNELVRMDRMNAELAIAGMWIAEDDGVLNARTVKVGPRKIIVANSVDSMKQLSAGGDWQLADARIAQLSGQIRRVLMADQLQPQDGPAMTATEVHVRVGLIRQLLGPIYGRLQAEWLAPMIERCFGLAYRAGVLGEAPASIAGAHLKVRYNNPLARAQKAEDVAALDRMLGSLTAMANLAAAVPAAAAAFDLVKFEDVSRETAEGLGVPLKVLRTKEELEAYRAQRADDQARQQQAEQAQQLGTMAADAAMQRSVKAA